MLASETEQIWRVGYISGGFDMFHVGHVNLIRRAKARCEKLIVGVLDDESFSGGKKKWPVMSLEARLAIVTALRDVDEVDVTTPALLNKVNAWYKYHFDAMFSGDDHANDGWAREEAELKALGADIVFFPYTKEVSSTALQDKVLGPKLDNAAAPQKLEDGFRYLFPFDKVRKGERIVLYGCGVVGEQFARQINALAYCEIVAYADSFAAPDTTRDGKRVLTPEALLAHEVAYDRIVIASTSHLKGIQGRLRILGIDPELIV